MRNAKEQGKSSRQKSKAPVVAKGLGKKKKVKVVEVELRSKSTKKSTSKPALTSPKKAIGKVASAAKKTTTVASKVQKVALSKKQTKKTVQERPVVAANRLTASPNSTLTPEMLLSPPERILKPFRRAAELNRQLAKKQTKEAAKKGSFLAKPNKKNKKYVVDLRVQSPGTVGYFANGGINPGPALIRLANVKGLDIIGLTDFYNASYIDMVNESAEGARLTILPGVDLCCRIGECGEVFITALYPEKTPSSAIYELLDELQVPKSVYGRSDYCLEMDFAEVVQIIERRGALVIPTKIDKTPYRQLAISQLVEKHGFHAFDLAHPDGPELFRSRWPNGGFTFFTFSNANALGQIGNRAGKVYLSQPGWTGLKELVSRRTNSDSQSS